MIYKHLSTHEPALIADFWDQGTKAYCVVKLLERSQETIYRVYCFLDTGRVYCFLDTGKTIKQRMPINAINSTVVVNKIQLPADEVSYITDQIAAGWTPDTIIGRTERAPSIIVCGRFTGCLTVVSMPFCR